MSMELEELYFNRFRTREGDDDKSGRDTDDSRDPKDRDGSDKPKR